MHTKIDYDMHVKFGYMQDIYEDCLKCTNKRIREKYPDVMNIIEIEDIIRFREMLEGDKDIKIQFILYMTNRMSTIEFDMELFVFVGNDHIFVADPLKILREKSSLMDISSRESMTMYPIIDV